MHREVGTIQPWNQVPCFRKWSPQTPISLQMARLWGLRKPAPQLGSENRLGLSPADPRCRGLACVPPGLHEGLAPPTLSTLHPNLTSERHAPTSIRCLPGLPPGGLRNTGMAGGGTAPYQAPRTANSRLSPSHSSLAFQGQSSRTPHPALPSALGSIVHPIHFQIGLGAPQGLEPPGDMLCTGKCLWS